ncbi:hypothetical protein [Flavobacterium oreochromis]|uniref:hypothetical protein n=1 Tax=Flavobacterium oreochromis TaxID=2906078 RepID=UPI000B4D1202|nr:hypothetical protein [Flavobacterium oreochromis]OWP75502.1 hypothetical protein BWG23_10685 [Flavobacterium oreochromis]
MRLAGYLKELKEDSFTIPIYTDKNDFFYHNVNDDYKIIGFNKADINKNNIQEYYLSIDFKLNGFGAYAFVGKNNYIKCNILSNEIYEIEKYLEDTTDKNKYLSVKEDVKSFIGYLNSIDKFNFDVIDVEVEQIFKLYTLERKGKIMNTIGKYIFTDITQSKSIDIPEILLEDYFSKFICEKEIRNNILKSNDLIKNKFIKYITDNEQNDSLKDVIISKLIHTYYECDTANSKKKLKEFNYKFNSDNDNQKLIFGEIKRYNTPVINEIDDLLTKKIFDEEK